MKAGKSCDRLTAVGSTWPVIAIADVAISRPTKSAPASPMNSFAGRQLSGKKPTQAPTRMAAISEARLK